MKVITINNIDYSVAEDWNEVTLAQFFDIQNIIKKYDKITSKMIFEILSYLIGCDYYLLAESDIKYINLLSDQFNFIFKNELPKEIKLEFLYNGKKYKMPEELYLTTLGEWADMDHFLKQKDNAIECAHQIIAIYAREDGEKKYNPTVVNKRSQEFLNLPVSVALPIINYIIKKKREYKNRIRYYSAARELTQKLNEKVIMRLQKNGGGIIRLLLWLITTYSNLMKSLKKMWLKFLTFWPIKLIEIK